jgi:hypothetical protein
MKTLATAALALICLAAPARAAETVCNINVDVTDTDPKGTNVRATPGGKIVASLPAQANDDWIEVHVIGQDGDWFLIDSAKAVGDDEKPIFRGRGYLHKSVVGTSGLQNGTTIWTDHDAASRPLDPSAMGDQAVTLLGCWHDFAKVRVKKGDGWTKGLCLNQRTTCA